MATEETGIAFTVSRGSFIFNHKVLSDVKVVVPVSNNGSESKVISAHKFVLAISSPLSSASFMVKWRRLKTLLNCLTVSTRVCWGFFRYIYSETVVGVKLSGSNMMQVHYLAKKLTPLLAEKCSEYLKWILTSSGAFIILHYGQKFED